MRYTSLRRLGRGGMGVVDLATDGDGRQVALKRVPLTGSAAEMDQAKRRIRREAELLAQLRHPAIVALLDVVDEGDDIVLVMPYLPGGTLAERVRSLGPLPADQVMALVTPLAGALAAAHRQGVVHRDVKPANVMFDAKGSPLLGDFGVAVSRDVTVGLTGTEHVVGTPTFMAPEQARGETTGPAADVFALGASLRFAATGRGPYGDDPRLAFSRAVAGQVERLPRILPEELRRLLASMCEPDPRRRPSAALLAGGPDGTSLSTPARTPRRRRVRPLLVASGTVGAVGLGLVALLVVRSDNGPADSPARATSESDQSCTELAYRPCGGVDAPGTNGSTCVDERADYDGSPANGCEAIPDQWPEGMRLIDTVEANLVPADDVDTYFVDVPDHAQLLCDGVLALTFTAPAGVAQSIEVFVGESLLQRGASADGTPVTIEVIEPECFVDDATTLTVRIASVGQDRTSANHTLQRSGSF